jgi:hypothetical protein
MARPERTGSEPSAPPIVDPLAIDRAYRLQRAKRRHRIEQRRRRKLAGFRFFVVLLLLLGLSVFLGLTIWQEIERLFGL